MEPSKSATPRKSSSLPVPQTMPNSARGAFQNANLPDLGRVGSEEIASQTDFGSAPPSARQSRRGSTSRAAAGGSAGSQQHLSKAEYEARRKRKEAIVKHGILKELRDQDAKAIKEKAARVSQDREKRSEEMLDMIFQEDGLRIDAARTINQFEREQENRRLGQYQKWDAEVWRRVERHISKFMTDEVPPVEEGWREELLRSDCPVRREVNNYKEEDNFHRNATNLLHSSAVQDIADVGLREHVRQREQHAKVVRSRDTTRPVLPIENWAQQHHYASRFGYFAQGSERAAQQGSFVGFHSARRMGLGAHMLDESDGVPAAGKFKHRFERNQLGMLAGPVAKHGESSKHRHDHGGGSGAPCQDHYFYEKGNAIVDEEFPIGKRSFPHTLL